MGWEPREEAEEADWGPKWSGDRKQDYARAKRQGLELERLQQEEWATRGPHLDRVLPRLAGLVRIDVEDMALLEKVGAVLLAGACSKGLRTLAVAAR